MTKSPNRILTQGINETIQALSSTILSCGFRYPGKMALILILIFCLSAALPAQEIQQVEPMAAEPQAVEVQANKPESSHMFTLSDQIIFDEYSIWNLINIGFRNMPNKWGFEASFSFAAVNCFGFSIKPSYSFLNFAKTGEKKFHVNASLRLGVLFWTITDNDDPDNPTSFTIPAPLIQPGIEFELDFSKKFSMYTEILFPHLSFGYISLELGVRFK